MLLANIYTKSWYELSLIGVRVDSTPSFSFFLFLSSPKKGSFTQITTHRPPHTHTRADFTIRMHRGLHPPSCDAHIIRPRRRIIDDGNNVIPYHHHAIISIIIFKTMKAVFSLIIASTTIIFLAGPCHALDTFLGPGILECNSGQCEFSGRAGMFGGCTDPCHTRTSRHSFDFSFKDVGDVTGLQSYRGKQCYYKYAKNINSYYPDQYIEIGKGCTAKCNGCEFAPTILFRKSSLLRFNPG